MASARIWWTKTGLRTGCGLNHELRIGGKKVQHPLKLLPTPSFFTLHLQRSTAVPGAAAFDT